MYHLLQRAAHTPRQLLITIEALHNPYAGIDVHQSDGKTLVRIEPELPAWDLIVAATDALAEEVWRIWATAADCPPFLHPLQWWSPTLPARLEYVPPQFRLASAGKPTGLRGRRPR